MYSSVTPSCVAPDTAQGSRLHALAPHLQLEGGAFRLADELEHAAAHAVQADWPRRECTKQRVVEVVHEQRQRRKARQRIYRGAG